MFHSSRSRRLQPQKSRETRGIPSSSSGPAGSSPSRSRSGRTPAVRWISSPELWTAAVGVDPFFRRRPPLATRLLQHHRGRVQIELPPSSRGFLPPPAVDLRRRRRPDFASAQE
uniref:Uncharacterized protein n=1 Tax=Leersia perrieri TaxID=77586 RepID=A0A0D9X717_9ORYZ